VGAVGEVFAGRYELVDPLGEGGAGVVWRAWDHRERRYVAAKVLRQVDSASLLRFVREQAVRIEHPHVLTPLGWAGEDDKVLFTMPIVSGGSVATLIGDFGPLPPRLVAVLLDQTLAALEGIHGRGIVHRDVKPANLLLEPTGRALPHLWLSDFGVAAPLDAPRLTHGPVALGTEGYLAPESRFAGWEPDPRADLYAVGMCAVEMLTGDRPGTGTVTAPALPDGLPAGLGDVVRRLTEFDPARRPATAAGARAALTATGLLDETTAERVLGEVEVFDQLPPLPAGWGPEGPREPVAAEMGAVPSAGSVAPTSVTAGETPSGEPVAETPQPPAGTRRGLGLATALLVAGALVLALTAYLVWG
jgi:serine/threonine-protein kinase